MIKFEIQNQFTGGIQFVAEIDCGVRELNSVKVGLAVKWGIKNGANLSGANLSGANLSGADLRDADLRYADLRDADLRYANLSDVKLHYANLHYANLRGANLRDADLRYADLRYANLRGAYLHYANLSGADLRGANYVSDIFIDGGIRSDGYRFILTRNTPGEWRIVAGCRNFGLKEAQKHWRDTRPKGEALGDETHLIIKNMMSIAKLRKWPLKGLEDDEAAS